MYKGDVGLFRRALLLAGFFPQSEASIFNDNWKDGTRRLKLWFAASVGRASQEQQQVLAGHLREFFGDRIISMYFTMGISWAGAWPQLCIRLKD
jgi:hypothetical protein